METKTWKPQEIDDVTHAFPAGILHLMPQYKDIPDEFKRGNTKWNQLICDWFFGGLSKLDLKLKDGLDRKKVLRHIGTILASYEPKHEHKEAGCAYLLSLWADDATWTPAKR